MPPGGQLTVIAQMNGIIQYVSRADVSNKNPMLASIPKSRFKNGLLHITLFSPQNLPVAERLIFIDHTPNLDINLQTDKQVYKPREKVKMNLTVKDEAGNPVMGAFSLAVTDESKIQSDEVDEHTILSDLLLASDLKGYVEQPNYYFIAKNEDKARQLDQLLLTQGWSRFVWKDVLADKLPAINYPAEKSLDLSGRLTLGNNPVENGSVKLFANSIPFADTVTDAKGNFKFGGLNFTDTAKFMFIGSDKKQHKNINIKLDNTLPQPVAVNRNYAETAVNVNQAMKTYLQNSQEHFDDLASHGLFKKTTVLKEVKITEHKLTRVEEALKGSRNLNGPGSADKVYTYMDMLNYTDLSTFLNSSASGIIVKKDSPILRGKKMALIVDGFKFDGKLSDLVISDIQSIEVLKNAGVYNAPFGAIVITLKQGGIDYSGNANVNNNGNGFLYDTFKGYNSAKQFYSPAYPVSA
jgi:hypothetical protein